LKDRKILDMQQSDTKQYSNQPSSMSDKAAVVRDELDFSLVTDRNRFLKSVGNLYTTIMRYEAIAKAEEYRRLHFADVRGEEIFEAAEELVKDIRERMSQYLHKTGHVSAEVTDQAVDFLQKKYDDLLTLRNLLDDVYVTVVPTERPVVCSASDDDVQKPVSQNEAGRVFTEFEKVLQAAERHVTVVQARVHTEISSSKWVGTVAMYGNELNDSVLRLADIKKGVALAKTERLELSLLQQMLNKYSRIISKLIKRVDTLEELIKKQKVDDTLDTQSMPLNIVSKVTPTITTLRERANKIMQRVTAGASYDAEVLAVARRLEHTFRTLADDPEGSDARVCAAYEALEKYVRTHEDEWLKLCGLSVPKPGIEGLLSARNLRETLLVERDRHQALVQDTKKQILVDKLIRKLSNIAQTGLSLEADIPEIVALFRAIDVPNQQGELKPTTREDAALILPTTTDADEEIQKMQPSVHKVMKLSTGDTEETVEIRVASNAKQRISEQAKIPTQILPLGNQSTDKTVSSALVSRLEKRDPVSKIKPIFTPKLHKAAPVLAEHSLTYRYLSISRYLDFITRHYTSTAAFERILDTTITRIESQTIDAIERWLGEEQAIAFTFLENLSVGEVLRLGENKEVRSILATENIKYETFLVWLDLIPEMQKLVSADLQQPFGSLYAKWMIESEIKQEAEMNAR